MPAFMSCSASCQTRTQTNTRQCCMYSNLGTEGRRLLVESLSGSNGITCCCKRNFQTQVPCSAPRRGSNPWRERAILPMVGATPVRSLRGGDNISRENYHPFQDRDGCGCDCSCGGCLERCGCCLGCSIMFFGGPKFGSLYQVLRHSNFHADREEE